MRSKIQVAAVYLVAGLLLWYLFKDTDWGNFYRAVRGAHWGWLGLGCGLVLAGFFARVQRWTYIVRTAKPVSFRSLFSATQIGFLGNFVLPGRIGEVIRALVLSRLSRLPFSKCFAFVALDRVTDLFGLMIVLLVSVIAFRPEADIPLPDGFLVDAIPKDAFPEGALVTMVVMLGVTGSFVLLYVRQALALRLSDYLTGLFGRIFSGILRAFGRVLPGSGERCGALAERAMALREHAHGMLQHFADGMHVFRSASDMGKTLFFSFITWTAGLLSYQCMMNAFDFGVALPWYTVFLVMSLLSIFISIPGPPGFVGTFHVAIFGAMFIVAPTGDQDAYRAVAIVAHLINLLAVIVVGTYCLHTEKLGLLALRQESREEHDDEEDGREE